MAIHSLLFFTIENRLKFYIHNTQSTFHCKLAFSIINTLKSFIKRGKAKLELFSNQNVIYKITYDDCEASCVGETKKN